MINVKGGGKLNISLASGLIDGYAGNNPFPAIAVDTKSGRIVCDLEDLPPGTFRDHPCCCIAAAEKALENKREPVIDLLVLFKMATDTINNDLDKAVLSAINWIGTSESVERMSIPTSGYSMDDTQHWHDTMNIWTTAMNRLDVFENKFKNTGYEDISATAYDFSLLNEAKEKLAQTTTKK
jgi:NitT/TauT family transport system substrate-binding protein